MFNVKLLEQIYPTGFPEDIQRWIKDLTDHFEKQRTLVSCITLLPNFCIDTDVQRFLMSWKKEFENIPIYRGLIVEVRPSYEISLEDARWIYPQLYKHRGLVELPKSADLSAIRDRMSSIREADLIGDSKLSDVKLSPVYNSIGIYCSQSTDSDFGMVENRSYVGYDLSMDEQVIPVWYTLLKDKCNAETIYTKMFSARLIHDTTVKNMVQEMVTAFLELVTDAQTTSMEHVTDIWYNCFFSNKHCIFFFNHAMNLLGAASHPPMLNRSCASGYMLYKPKTVKNTQEYNFAWPIDTGFTGDYHNWDHMHETQQDRVKECFVWTRELTPFNTWLMKSVRSDKTSEWKAVENILQVVADRIITLSYARVSTHKHNSTMRASDILKIHPGEADECVAFPMEYTHEIIDLLVTHYAEIHQQVNILRPEFYDEHANTILIPKGLAKSIVDGYAKK